MILHTAMFDAWSAYASPSDSDEPCPIRCSDPAAKAHLANKAEGNDLPHIPRFFWLGVGGEKNFVSSEVDLFNTADGKTQLELIRKCES